MSESDLQAIVNAVIQRAQRQGFVLPEEMRDELTRAGQPKLHRERVNSSDSARVF